MNLRTLLEPSAPYRLAKNQRTLDEGYLEKVQHSLFKHYFDRNPAGYLETPLGKEDLANHLTQRLDLDRRHFVPWLDQVRPLNGARILEIGSGTGCSTVALAEQGASVDGLDVDAPALQVAADRASAMGLDNVEFHEGNATEVKQKFAKRKFDYIIFYASLEHMTHEERLVTMRDTWEMLPSGGVWSVIGTPNRLWIHDFHTSFLPFYFWLPDDLAFAYSRFSPRANFNDLYRNPTEEKLLSFLRRGRGLSYHEFELAMDGFAGVTGVSSFAQFHRKRSPLRALKYRFTRDRAFEKQIRQARPDLHPGFFHKMLDLTLIKP